MRYVVRVQVVNGLEHLPEHVFGHLLRVLSLRLLCNVVENLLALDVLHDLVNFALELIVEKFEAADDVSMF
jgi:hypothetical protein